jgi:hypothetical protein
MMKLAHIVNPVRVSESSDLSIAQPITFETMRRARSHAVGEVDVELYTTQYAEDRPVAPPDFLHTLDLERSVLDVGRFRHPRKLPLLEDILHRLYEATDADYLVYTNVDIGLQPHFYIKIRDLIEAGHNAFVINRRTIDRDYDQLDEIPLMYASIGRPHPGWDCFIFRRTVFPEYDLGKVCIGAPRCGLALLANLLVHADNFTEFKQLHLTFHRGDDRTWSSHSVADYAAHNTREVVALLGRLEQRYGKFGRRTPPGQFLFRKRYFGPLYEGWVRWSHLPARKS